MPVQQAECNDCRHRFYLQGSDLQNIVRGGGCPNCGGHQIYRSQPSPTHPDMEARDMVDPGLGNGEDQGGNPLREGILGDYDNRMKRDESFASVKHATEGYDGYGIPCPLCGSRETNPMPGGNSSDIYCSHCNRVAILPKDTQALLHGEIHHPDPWMDNEPGTMTIPKHWGKQAGPMEEMLGLEPQAPQVEHQLGWTPGMHGRALFVGNDMHSWNAYDPKTVMDTLDTGLQHAQYVDKLGVDPRHVRWDSGIEIEPDGGVDPIAGRNIKEHIAADPRLHEKENLWGFSSVSAAVGEQQYVQVLPHPQAGIHNGPISALSKENVLINGQPATGDFFRTHTPMNPDWETVRQQPVTLSHPDPAVLDAARQVVESGNERLMHPLLYNSHKEDVQPHPNGFTHDVIMGLGNLDSYVNNARIRSIAQRGEDGQMGLDHDGTPVQLGARNPEELAIAKRVLQEGSSNPAREYRLRQQQVQAKASSLALNKRPMDTLDQTIHMPWTAKTADVFDSIGNAASDVGNFVGQNAVPIGLGLAGGALMATGVGALGPGEALMGAGAADAAGTAGADALATGAADVGGTAAADAGGSAASTLMKGAFKKGVGLATGAAKGFMKNEVKKSILGDVLGNGQNTPVTSPNTGIDGGYWGFQGSTKESDFESPTSMPSVPGLGNDTYEDPREFAADSTINNLNDPTVNGIGGSGAPHPTIREFYKHLPLLYHYYNSEESGAEDPHVLRVHRALDAASPGYLALAGEGLHHVHHHHHHGKEAALDQGPQTDEQKAAVAELLERSGRAKEIPIMLEQGYLYAKELSQVQHKLNAPPQNVPADQQVQPPAPPAPPGGGMPMPGMASPQPALSSIVKRFATDNIAPRCPKCKSHTTGLISDEGSCRCHNCGNVWKESIETTKVGSDNIAPRCPKCKSHTTGLISDEGSCRCHNCGNVWKVDGEVTKVGAGEHEHPNIVNAPAAEQRGQRDVSKEQDSSHFWSTANGEPLRVGETYQMHSGKYNIPDVVRVESVKPDSIDFVIQSQYGLDPRDSITRDEAKIEGLTFTTYHEDQKDGNDLDNTTSPPDSNNQAGASPGQVSDLSSPGFHSNVTAAAFGPQVGEEPSHPKPEVPTGPTPEPDLPQAPKETKPKTKSSSTVCSNCQSEEITSALHSPEVRHFDCYRCGHDWNESELDELDKVSNVLPEESRAWIQADTGAIDHIPVDRSGQTRDIGLKTAGAKFSPSQQREFIDERGKARNSDRLNLTDTHYKARSDKGSADLINDDHLFLGV